MNQNIRSSRFVSWRKIFLAFAWATALAAPVRGELKVVEGADGQEGLTVFKMTVTPAAEPVPAFAYRLVPTESELRPGNAALYYTRAFAENGVAGAWKGIEKTYGFDEVHGGEKTNGWYTTDRPLADLPMDKVRAAAANFDTIIEQFVARGTVRKDCDWGRNLEELQGLDIIGLLLPEVQESRSLSRALMLRTRVAIADGDYAAAVNYLKMNYQLGRNVARDPILVSGLVGIAECNMGHQELIELIAAPDSPNLYWAIAAMPRPLIDLQPAMQSELGWQTRLFPVLADAETAEHSPDEWSRLLADSLTSAQEAIGNGAKFGELKARMAVAGLALYVYSDAKDRLVASGMDASRIEQMSVGQVIAIDAARESRRISDEFEKSWYGPYRPGKTAHAESMLHEHKLEGGMGRALAEMLLPALESVQTAQARTDWQLGAIQIVEAIRLHAAATGKLPASLDEIKSVVLPQNPVTGAAYQYRLDGDTAVLELPKSDGFPGVAWRFEIQLAK